MNLQFRLFETLKVNYNSCKILYHKTTFGGCIDRFDGWIVRHFCIKLRKNEN